MTDRAAFDALLIAQLPKLKGQAFNLTRDIDDADDLVQSAVERMLVKWREFTPERNFGPWAATILKHEFINGTRKFAARAILIAVTDSIRVAPPSQDLPLIARDVSAAVKALSVQDRWLLAQSAAGMPSEQLGARMHTPPSNARKRLFRARRSLYRHLCGVEAHA